MNVTKTAIVLGITILGLMGTIQYMSKQDTSPMMHIHDAFDGLKDYKLRVELFKNWMQEHQKTYSVDEYHMRFAIWNKVYDYVQEHNAMNMSWTAGLNQFSDLTSEEFSSLHLGLNYDPNRVQENVVVLDENDIANDIDWRSKGAVNPIENQGTCGSCYTYSAAGALESLYFIKKGVLVPLSKQQLLDCTSNYGNQGCNGGWMNNCFKYTKEKGSMKASDYKYTGKVASCKYSSSKVVFKNTAYADVTKNSPTQLKAATNKGTVTVAVQANQAAFQNYKSGVITSNCGKELDHAVLVVGYTSDAWIVRNSWGTSWGDKGYLKIAIGSQNSGAGVCGINSAASYPTA